MFNWGLIIAIVSGVTVFALWSSGRLVPLLRQAGGLFKTTRERLGDSLNRSTYPSSATAAEKLKKQTERERTRATELKAILEAKQELMRVRAENQATLSAISRLNEKSVVLDAKTSSQTNARKPDKVVGRNI